MKDKTLTTWEALETAVVECSRCPRLRKHCQKIAQEKKKEFRAWDYWGKPVPGFGDRSAWLWIVGLAPAAHGANRTGRMFTGDSSGNWLYRALYRAQFANQPLSERRGDGLVLEGVYISAAARCAPPDNKPTLEELRHCEPFLDAELSLLGGVTTFLGLGKIGFEAILAFLKRHGHVFPGKKPSFFHGAHYQIGPYNVVASYHPSRQNTQTGRLTEGMWQEIFDNLKKSGTKKSSPK